MVKLKKGLNPKDNLGVKSDLAPTTQIAKVLLAGGDLAGELKFVAGVFESLKKSNLRYYMICRILFLTGSRISEVLSLKCSSVDPSGAILIKGAKGGKSKVFQDTEVSQFLIKMRGCEGLVFYGITRFHIYRCLKQFGFKYKSEGKENYKVTHYFRHLYTKRMRAMGADKETIKTELKHNSNRSQSSYGNYKKV